eukprot:COSAG05_NODE_226_length_13453_cov_12.522315_15_plen_103_part_00
MRCVLAALALLHGALLLPLNFFATVLDCSSIASPLPRSMSFLAVFLFSLSPSLSLLSPLSAAKCVVLWQPGDSHQFSECSITVTVSDNQVPHPLPLPRAHIA